MLPCRLTGHEASTMTQHHRATLPAAEIKERPPSTPGLSRPLPLLLGYSSPCRLVDYAARAPIPLPACAFPPSPSPPSLSLSLSRRGDAEDRPQCGHLHVRALWPPPPPLCRASTPTAWWCRGGHLLAYIVRCTAALARSATFSRQSSHHPLLGLVPPLSPYLFLPDLSPLVFTEVCSNMHTNCAPVLQKTLAAYHHLFATDLAASFPVFIDVHTVMNR